MGDCAGMRENVEKQVHKHREKWPQRLSNGRHFVAVLKSAQNTSSNRSVCLCVREREGER
jgi:hypothetical protein